MFGPSMWLSRCLWLNRKLLLDFVHSSEGILNYNEKQMAMLNVSSWFYLWPCFILDPKLIGSPDDTSLGFLRSDNARRYARSLPQYPKQQFGSRFPNMSSGAMDLLERMLVFDPSKRITGNLAASNDLAWLQNDKFNNVNRCFRITCKIIQTKLKCRSIIKPCVRNIMRNVLLKDANLHLFFGGIAVDEALCHPYLASLHEINDEPVCPAPFSFDFEQPSFTEEDIKELIWREALKFNPEPIHWAVPDVEKEANPTGKSTRFVGKYMS